MAFAALAILVIGVIIIRRGQTTGQTTGEVPRRRKKLSVAIFLFAPSAFRELLRPS